MRTTETRSQKTRLAVKAVDATGVQLFAPLDGVSPPANSVAGVEIRGRSVLNTTTAALTVVCGSVADLTTQATVVLAASGGYWEVPFNYDGEVSGKLATGTGNVNTTEYY